MTHRYNKSQEKLKKKKLNYMKIIYQNNLSEFVGCNEAVLRGHCNYLKVESVINNLPKQKAWGSYGFSVEYYQTFKGYIISVFYNPVQRIEAERTIFLFGEVSITLQPETKAL